MRWLCVIVLLTGCSTFEADLIKFSAEVDVILEGHQKVLNDLHTKINSLELSLKHNKEHCRYLEDEQDDINDALDELKGGQRLIELKEEEPCRKCEPIPAIFMGPWPPAVEGWR